MVAFLRNDRAEHRDTGAHHVHRMRRRRNLLQRRLYRRGNAARVDELRLVRNELAHRRQLAVHEQISDLLELAHVGDIENVVAAIVEIIAGAPHRAKRGVARDDAGERNRFLRLWRGGGGFVHRVLGGATSTLRCANN